MKGLEQFTDVIAVMVGMVGAMAKGIKKRVKAQAILIGMIIAGILSYSLIGVVEIFYNELTPRLVILISFVVGWVANELTELLDESVGELYEWVLSWIKRKTK